MSKGLMQEVERWGGMKQTGVSLRYMMEFGMGPTEKNLLISAQFLHNELPARIARRGIELQTLPFGLSHKPALLKVRDWYLDSFRDLRSFPEIKDTNDELEFTQMIKMIKVRHNNVVPMMALGVQQLKKGMDPKIVCEDLDEIHQFLDRFYMSRIGIRMLIGQHVALHDPNPPPDCVGYIHTKMSPVEVARCASEDARAICLREYGSAPDVNIYGTFQHLHLMVFELVKNSSRAVQERFMDLDKVAPPIRIIVADGLEDVTIKVSDEGGGIPRSGLPKMFTYLYSTAKNPLDEQSDLGTADRVTMAGYGYGLSIIKLLIRAVFRRGSANYLHGRIWDRCISSFVSFGRFSRIPAMNLGFGSEVILFNSCKYLTWESFTPIVNETHCCQFIIYSIKLPLFLVYPIYVLLNKYKMIVHSFPPT